ncbi:MAG: hypothetical protein ACAH59_01795 [Pseudobdellovibrionaceae bacterium]
MLAASPKGPYALSNKFWLDEAKLIGNTAKSDLKDGALIVRAVAADRAAPAAAAMNMERTLENLLTENGGGMIVAKISLSPFNERSFSLHMASGTRVIGAWQDANNEIWAVVGKHYSKTSP